MFRLLLFHILSNITNIENGIVKKIMEKFNRIDILFVNSGGPKLGSFFSLTEDEVNDSLREEEEGVCVLNNDGHLIDPLGGSRPRARAARPEADVV